MRRIMKIARNPLTVALFLSLTLAGCAGKKNMNGGYENGGGGVATPGSPQDFTVNVGDRVFFNLDSSSIRPDGQQTLARQAEWLKRYPNYAITIEGHADERGTREYNIALGQRRAVAARDFLVSQGIPMNRLRTISYGKERPVAVCDEARCWNQNRRAVTVLNGIGSGR